MEILVDNTACRTKVTNGRGDESRRSTPTSPPSAARGVDRFAHGARAVHLVHWRHRMAKVETKLVRAAQGNSEVSLSQNEDTTAVASAVVLVAALGLPGAKPPTWLARCRSSRHGHAPKQAT
eukprot:7449697-Pyramimonas_sp.AAC.1